MEVALKTMNMYFSLLTVGVSLFLCVNAQQQAITATCQIYSLNVPNRTVSGLLTLSQPYPGANTSITGHLTGFTWAGPHGFHVHQYGSIGNLCNDAGSHYDPYNKTHGGPNDAERHLGDLGNIVSDANMDSHVNITDNQIQLQGNNSVVGLAIVVHANEDDLGKGTFNDSKTTGHSGYRIGCCVITLNQTTTSQTPSPTVPSTTTSRGSPVADHPLAAVLVLCLVAVQRLIQGRISG